MKKRTLLSLYVGILILITVCTGAIIYFIWAQDRADSIDYSKALVYISDRKVVYDHLSDEIAQFENDFYTLNELETLSQREDLLEKLSKQNDSILTKIDKIIILDKDILAYTQDQALQADFNSQYETDKKYLKIYTAYSNYIDSERYIVAYQLQLNTAEACFASISYSLGNSEIKTKINECLTELNLVDISLLANYKLTNSGEYIKISKEYWSLNYQLYEALEQEKYDASSQYNTQITALEAKLTSQKQSSIEEIKNFNALQQDTLNQVLQLSL